MMTVLRSKLPDIRIYIHNLTYIQDLTVIRLPGRRHGQSNTEIYKKTVDCRLSTTDDGMRQLSRQYALRTDWQHEEAQVWGSRIRLRPIRNGNRAYQSSGSECSYNTYPINSFFNYFVTLKLYFHVDFINYFYMYSAQKKVKLLWKNYKTSKDSATLKPFLKRAVKHQKHTSKN